MMEYEELLNSAFEKIKSCEPSGKCDRFEILKVEGCHEGIKTILSNFIQIASCLRREPEHLAKFLFKELASSGEMAGERLILTRKISSQTINLKVEKYAKNFVLCPSCGKPDTELINEKAGLFIRCLACGLRKQVNNI